VPFGSIFPYPNGPPGVDARGWLTGAALKASSGFSRRAPNGVSSPDGMAVPAGRLYTLVRDAMLDSRDSVIFLKHMLPHPSEKLLVIWDGSPVHTGYVCALLAEGGTRQIHGEPLPPTRLT
jgi:hypothetical protein